MIRRLLIILLILFALSVMASAQNDTIMLESVEINAAHVFNKVSKETMERKIDTAVIKRLQTRSLSQLLIQHSPVFIKTYGPGGTASASFRGTTSSHTLVLWNGFQLNSPTLGEVDFSMIPVFFTDGFHFNGVARPQQTVVVWVEQSISLTNRNSMKD